MAMPIKIKAVAGNVVVLDGLLLIDQRQGVEVGLPHPEEEGLAQPLVWIKAEVEVNLNTFFCLFVLHTYHVLIQQYKIHCPKSVFRIHF